MPFDPLVHFDHLAVIYGDNIALGNHVLDITSADNIVSSHCAGCQRVSDYQRKISEKRTGWRKKKVQRGKIKGL